jgi:NhaA family Na+:H+ antiporter
MLAACVGLCIGKPLGILGTLWLLLRARVIALPSATSATEMAGVGMVAGVGMTVSIFLADVSFAAGQWRDSAILGVLVGSVSAALMAGLHFRLRRKHRLS